MYKTFLYDSSYSDIYNDEISRFISSNTVEILNYYMDDFEDTDLEVLFPEAYVESHSKSECFKVLKTIRDRMNSYVL